MTAFQVFSRQNEETLAMVRAVAAVQQSVSDLKSPTQLVACEEAVKVAGDWWGFGGIDSKGRMVLWAEGCKDPFLYGPTVGESFIWRPLIGDAS